MATSDSTTYRSYLVYRIVNFRDGKVCVGKTCNLKHRHYEHFWKLKSGKHNNIHLQRAFDKDGCEAFYFEVLETGISSENINARESYWIAYFDSYKHGYNQTSGGDDNNTRGVTCVWNNQEFTSIAEAARANNVNLSTMLHRLKRGWTCDLDLPIKGKVITWNGLSFCSINEASRSLNIPLTTLHRWLKLGFKDDNDIADFDTSCTWNGVSYVSARQAGLANGIHPTVMQERIRKGYTCDDDMK